MPDENERRLVEQAQQGSSFALAQLLQAHYASVYHTLLGLTLDPHRAADLTQDCMERVIDRFHLYDPGRAALSTWMTAIAKNLFIDDCRRRRREAPFPDEMPGDPDPADRVIENDELLGLLKGLSEKARAPLLLKYSGGYSLEEIARLLHIPTGTVKSRISNALSALRKELDRRERSVK